MKETKNVPQLRFSEFDVEWEEKKLGEVSDRVTRKNENLESTLPLTISAQYGLVDQITFFNNQVASTTNLRNYFLVKNGEFAYNKSYSAGYPWGAIKRLDRYEKGVLSTLYIVFKPKNINSDYLLSYYDTDKWYKQVSEIAAEGARNHGLLNIAPNDFFQTTFTAPISEIEQQKIGTFLSHVDSLIQAKTKKLESLKAVKKSLLQKCFPKAGEKVPEMRFAGFSGDWEESQLSELLEVSNLHNRDDKFRKEDIYSVSREFGVINQIEYQGKSLAGASLVNYKVVKRGNVVYTKSPLAEQPYGIIKANKNKDGIVSTLYGVYKEKDNCDSNFIQIYFDDNNRLNDYLRPLINKGAKNTILVSDEDALSGLIKYPSKPEQQKIGQFFSKYDSLISAQQKEIDKLKYIKKSLLQKMFI